VIAEASDEDRERGGVIRSGRTNDEVVHRRYTRGPRAALPCSIGLSATVSYTLMPLSSRPGHTSRAMRMAASRPW
jgi:hypothetical protein